MDCIRTDIKCPHHRRNIVSGVNFQINDVEAVPMSGVEP